MSTQKCLMLSTTLGLHGSGSSLPLVLALEDEAAGEEQVHDAPDRPHVHCGRQRVALDDLVNTERRSEPRAPDRGSCRTWCFDESAPACWR